MESHSKLELVAFTLGAASVPVGAAWASRATSFGLTFGVWPLDAALAVLLASLASGVLLPCRRWAAVAGVWWGVALSAAYVAVALGGISFVIALVWFGAAIVASCIGAGSAWLIHLSRRPTREAPRCLHGA
jgi:hypothetical protein